MKTIILVTTSYPSSSDGSEAAGSFVRDFAQELAGKAKVVVVAPGNNEPATVLQGSVQVERYLTSGKPLSLLKPYNPLHWLAIVRVLLAGADKLEQVVLALGTVDHIFALWVLPSGAWAMKMKQKYGIEFSTWALGSDIWSLGKIPVVRAKLRSVLKASANNFADGHQLCKDVESLSARTCEFLPSTRKFLPAAAAATVDTAGYKLAFLGRWHPNKGIDLLLSALQLLTDTDWQLISEVRICGGGPLKEKVAAAVAQLKAQGRNVTLGGYLDKEQAAALFAWTDYVLIPSRIESIPVVFSDAMKAGKPVIATPVGDLHYLLDHYQCGVAAKAATAEAIVAAIKQSLRADSSSFTAGLTRAAADFSLPQITERFLAAID